MEELREKKQLGISLLATEGIVGDSTERDYDNRLKSFEKYCRLNHFSLDYLTPSNREPSLLEYVDHRYLDAEEKADAGGTTLQQLVSDKKPQPSHNTERLMMSADLNRLLDSKLTERESDVLRMRYGLRDGRPRTLAESGRSMSVTRERIRQIETRALQKLRSPANSHVLKEYMESETMNMD